MKGNDDMIDQRDREQELATGVVSTKAELIHAMAEPVKGSEQADDMARRLLAGDGLTAGQRIGIQRALDRFTAAVNALWVHAEQSGVTRRIASAWVRRNRKNLAEVGRDEYEAEATFAMRSAVASFKPGSACLDTFATRFVCAALDEYRGQALSPLGLPGRVARVTRRTSRAEFQSEESAAN